MTASPHDQNESEPTALERAIAWLSVHIDDCPQPIIPHVKQTFGLRNLDAVEALRLARLKRGGAID